MAFVALLVLSAVSLSWLHLTVLQLRQASTTPVLASLPGESLAETAS
jgi:hypothetical protein